MRLEARTVAAPSFDVVKMEDRKRPAGPDDSAPAPKRQAVTVNGSKSHQEADLPWKDDIEVRPLPARLASTPALHDTIR